MSSIPKIGGLVTALFLSSAVQAQLVPTGTGNTAQITNPTAYNVLNPQPDGTITLNFDGSVKGSNVSGLTAQLSLTFLGVSGSSYYFSYSLLDTSAIASRVSGFAFDTTPDAIGGSAQGLFTGLTVDANYPNGVKAVDVCLSNDKGSGCSGKGGVSTGSPAGTGTLSLLFPGGAAPASLNLSNFHVRYQDVVSPYGNSGTGNFSSLISVPPAVPEPASWALMLLGYAALGSAVRRSRNQQVPRLT